MKKINRRDFLKKSGKSVILVGGLPLISLNQDIKLGSKFLRDTIELYKTEKPINYFDINKKEDINKRYLSMKGRLSDETKIEYEDTYNKSKYEVRFALSIANKFDPLDKDMLKKERTIHIFGLLNEDYNKVINLTDVVEEISAEGQMGIFNSYSKKEEGVLYITSTIPLVGSIEELIEGKIPKEYETFVSLVLEDRNRIG